MQWSHGGRMVVAQWSHIGRTLVAVKNEDFHEATKRQYLQLILWTRKVLRFYSDQCATNVRPMRDQCATAVRPMQQKAERMAL